jgi:hypothetical protein
MSKNGVDDELLWKRLKEVRIGIDSIYDEKLLTVQKIYNLTQKFVQELDLQNIEQMKHIRSQAGTISQRTQNV